VKESKLERDRGGKKEGYGECE